MSVNILIADDDCDRALAPLARIIRNRPGVSVKTALTFVDALDILKRDRGVEHTRIHSMLLDTILPYDRYGNGASRTQLGVQLAERAANLGVTTIVFLTVVRIDEVADQFSELRKTFPAIRFDYFDKTELLNGSALQNLIDFVVWRPGREHEGT